MALAVSALLLTIQEAAWRNMQLKGVALTNRSQLVDEALSKFPAHLTAHSTLLHGMIPPAILPATYTILSQSWSVSLEWQFDLLAPLILWTLPSLRRWPIALVFVANLVAASGYFSDGFLGSKIQQFFVEILAFCALNKGCEQADRSGACRDRRRRLRPAAGGPAWDLDRGAGVLDRAAVLAAALAGRSPRPATGGASWRDVVLDLPHPHNSPARLDLLSQLGLDMVPLTIAIVAATLTATYGLSRAT